MSDAKQQMKSSMVVHEVHDRVIKELYNILYFICCLQKCKLLTVFKIKNSITNIGAHSWNVLVQ